MSIFKSMIELQHSFNQQIDKDYLDKNWNWNSAIIVESGELLDSLGYKWWKKQESDMENVKVEAIDLLHFIISENIQYSYASKNLNIKEVEEDFENFFMEYDSYDGFCVPDLEKLISYLNYDEYSRFSIMKQIFKQLNMSNEDVYIAYIVKNCLNKFRQDNGYKEGTYNKIWNGKEDNIIAYNLANELGAIDNLFEELYKKLNIYYIGE